LSTFAKNRARIVIEPTGQKTWDLDELLRGIIKKNRHERVDFGPAVAKEIR
jgi:antitoxin component of MazEF toxin-antitoxin module